jgi:hypothetical protein
VSCRHPSWPASSVRPRLEGIARPVRLLEARRA